jgi:hypothetical protein
MSSVQTSHGSPWWNWSRLRLEGLEVRFMGVVAVGAEEIALVSVPIPASAAVDACPPIPVFLSVTLPAQAIGLLEKNRRPAGEMELVSVFRIVAVQAPAVFLVMQQHDFRVKPRQISPFPVHGHHAMAVGAWVDPR